MFANTETTDDARLEWIETLERLRRFVASRVGDWSLAEEITQDVIVRSIATGALDRVDDPVGWLIRSAANAVIDHHRGRRRHMPFADVGELTSDAELADEAASMIGGDARTVLTDCVRPMVDRLDSVYREAITLVDLEGMTQSDAAAAVGISVSGMKSRVQRGRRQLKAMITSCCDVEVDRRGGLIEVTPRGQSYCCLP